MFRSRLIVGHTYRPGLIQLFLKRGIERHSTRELPGIGNCLLGGSPWYVQR